MSVASYRESMEMYVCLKNSIFYLYFSIQVQSSKPLYTKMPLITYVFGRRFPCAHAALQAGFQKCGWTVSQTVQKTSRAELWRIFHKMKGRQQIGRKASIQVLLRRDGFYIKIQDQNKKAEIIYRLMNKTRPVQCAMVPLSSRSNLVRLYL
jgi:hypothetical protein